MTTVVNFIIKQQGFSTLHTDAHDRLDDISTHHKPHFPQDPKCFSSLLATWCDPQRSVSPWSAWRRGASAARRSRRRLVRGCRQRSAGYRGCARTAIWRRATSGDRVVRMLVCASCFPYMFRLTSLGVSSVCRRANPAELRALLTRVYHRTWAGSREMVGKIGDAWVRRLKACVAAKGGFFE